jgi:hypothetical protein
MKLLSGAIPFRRSREQPPTPGPEPVPPPAPEPAPPAPEPQPPTPDPTPPAPELRAVPPSEPEPAARIEPEPGVTRMPLNGAPREWNVWELERLARYAEARDEEVAFLLLELRQFADAHGRLPVSFDPVIRESFGELLYAAV